MLIFSVNANINECGRFGSNPGFRWFSMNLVLFRHLYISRSHSFLVIVIETFIAGLFWKNKKVQVKFLCQLRSLPKELGISSQSNVHQISQCVWNWTLRNLTTSWNFTAEASSALTRMEMVHILEERDGIPGGEWAPSIMNKVWP